MAKEVQKCCRFKTSNTIPAWRTIFSKSNPNTYNKFQTASNLTGRSPNSLKPRFIHQNQTLNPFEPLQKARTSNLFGQKWAEPRPKSRNTKLRTPLNLGSSTKIELWTLSNFPKILNFDMVLPNTIQSLRELLGLKLATFCKLYCSSEELSNEQHQPI